MKLFIALLGLFASFTSFASPAINWDVYDYFWQGETDNPEACTTYQMHVEDWYAGPPPYPTVNDYTHYAPLPCNYANKLHETRIVWSSTAMTSAYELSILDGVILSSNNVGSATASQPKRLTEMSNYAGRGIGGGSGENSRYSHGRERFWVNSVTNGLYHFRASFSGGYWDTWFPGHLTPGDIWSYPTTPIYHNFNYVNDVVKINNILCNSSGQVTFYWNPTDANNPTGGRTIDLTPTVGNAARNAHWVYYITLEIIP